MLTLGINLLFWSGYSVLGHAAVFPLWQPPMMWIDLAIPYRPEPWGWIYLSQFLFTGTLPWLIESRDGLRRYVFGLILIVAVSFLIFFLWPSASPRGSLTAQSGSMSLILGYDGKYNAFPSLHAAFLVYMAALAFRMFDKLRTFGFVLFCIIWGLGILYSTIATRQHYAIDLVAGGVLGALADWWAWRGISAEIAAMTMERSSRFTSHDGCK